MVRKQQFSDYIVSQTIFWNCSTSASTYRLKSLVNPVGSAITQYLKSHFVGLFLMYCLKWVLALDFTILSSTDSCFKGWYSSEHLFFTWYGSFVLSSTGHLDLKPPLEVWQHERRCWCPQSDFWSSSLEGERPPTQENVEIDAVCLTICSVYVACTDTLCECYCIFENKGWLKQIAASRLFVNECLTCELFLLQALW